MAEKELKTEQAILSRFQEMQNELATLSGQANELAAESQEHDLVLKALEPMDGARRCYRVVSRCRRSITDIPVSVPWHVQHAIAHEDPLP